MQDLIWENIAPALVIFARAANEIIQPIKQQIEANTPAILESIKHISTVQQVFSVADKLGEHQFVVVDRIPKLLVERASKGENIDDLAVEFLITDEIIQKTADDCGRDKSTLLDQSIKAIFNGSYNLAMLGLFAELDKELSEQTGNIRSVNFRKRYESINKAIEEKGELFLDEMAGRDYLLCTTYKTAIDGIGDDEKFDKQEPNEINRNWIMHGRSEKEYTRLDCVKVLNLIYGTIRLAQLAR